MIQVFSVDETQKVGSIRKQFSGLIQEMYTNADNFGITFPMDLAVTVKATLLGAVFLIVSITTMSPYHPNKQTFP